VTKSNVDVSVQSGDPQPCFFLKNMSYAFAGNLSTCKLSAI